MFETCKCSDDFRRSNFGLREVIQKHNTGGKIWKRLKQFGGVSVQNGSQLYLLANRLLAVGISSIGAYRDDFSHETRRGARTRRERRFRRHTQGLRQDHRA